MSSIAVVSHVALWLAVAAMGFMMLGIMRNLNVLAWRLDQLDAMAPRRIGRDGVSLGRKAPDFDLMDMTGNRIRLASFVGRDLFLVFTQPGCGPCDGVMPDLLALQKNRGMPVFVISNGEPDEVHDWAAEHAAGLTVLRQEDWALSRRYEVFATPFAFVIDKHGRIAAKGIVNNGEHIGFVLAIAEKRLSASAVERQELNIEAA